MKYPVDILQKILLFTYPNPSRFTTFPELIGGIINAILLILAALATVMIVIAGIKYMTSPSSGEVAKAAEGIRNAILGLIVVMGAYLIVQFVVQALV
jgi:hypothetical protein